MRGKPPRTNRANRAPEYTMATKPTKTNLKNLALAEASLATATVGRNGGIEGKRASTALLADLSMLGIRYRGDLTLKTAGMALSLLAHHGGLRWTVGADGKPGAAPWLKSLTGIEAVTASIRVPAYGRSPGGLEIVDSTGGVWRSKGGKATRVLQLKTTNQRMLTYLADATHTDEEKATAWLSFHLASHNMAGGITADLEAKPEAKPEASVEPTITADEPTA
jgi:hypothetical protein